MKAFFHIVSSQIETPFIALFKLLHYINKNSATCELSHPLIPDYNSWLLGYNPFLHVYGEVAITRYQILAICWMIKHFPLELLQQSPRMLCSKQACIVMLCSMKSTMKFHENLSQKTVAKIFLTESLPTLFVCVCLWVSMVCLYWLLISCLYI